MIYLYRNALRKTMIRVFYKMFALAGFFKLFNDLCQFAQPVMLNLLIAFVQDREAPYSRGFLIVLGMQEIIGGEVLIFCFSDVFFIGYPNNVREHVFFWHIPCWHAGRFSAFISFVHV